MVEAMLKFYNSFMSVFIKSVNINSVFPSWRSLSRFSHPVYQFPWKCLQLRRKFRFFLVLVQNSINVQNWWFCFDLIKGCNQISKSLLFLFLGMAISNNEELPGNVILWILVVFWESSGESSIVKHRFLFPYEYVSCQYEIYINWCLRNRQ